MAVAEDINAAKARHFKSQGNAEGKVTCEITGQPFAIYESHVDHMKPMTFQVIVTTFVEAKNIDIHADVLSAPADAQFSTTFIDEELRNEFREYHRSVARLRIISAQKNLSLGGSERIREPKNPVDLL